MKKFYSVICTFFAAIQTAAFLLFFIPYLNGVIEHGFNAFGSIVDHIGYWLISYFFLFIIAVIDKFVRGLYGFSIIFLDAFLSPFRFIAQLITMILCFCDKVEIERGEYNEYRIWDSIVFTLCTVEASKPMSDEERRDLIKNQVERSRYRKEERARAKARYGSGYSSPSSSSSYTPSTSSSSYTDEGKKEEVYGYFAVMRAMEWIAKSTYTSVSSSFGAWAKIYTTCRISGGIITYKFNVKFEYTERIQSEAELDDFKRDIQRQQESIAYSIRDKVQDWMSSHLVDRDYSLRFE